MDKRRCKSVSPSAEPRSSAFWRAYPRRHRAAYVARSPNRASNTNVNVKMYHSITIYRENISALKKTKFAHVNPTKETEILLKTSSSSFSGRRNSSDLYPSNTYKRAIKKGT